MGACGGQVPTEVEIVIACRVAGKEMLRRAGRSKTLHLSVSSSDRHVRTLSPVIQALAPTMDAGKTKAAESRIIRAIAISDDRRGHESLVLQKLAHQAQCCILVAPGLNENVEDFTFIIDSAPQIHLSTGN